MKSRKKTSVIWRLPLAEMQSLLDSSDSVVSVLSKLGLNPASGNHRTLHKRIKEEGLSMEKLKKNRQEKTVEWSKRFSKAYVNEDVFCENSTYGRNHLKTRIIQQGLISYVCSVCGNKGHYNGYPLSLQLHHVNGIASDNRLENLRFVCPNCHSQTKTFSGKKKKKAIEKKRETTEERRERGIAQNMRLRKFNPSKEELESDLKSMSFLAMGRKYGVSDNAVRKRCKLYGLMPL